MTYVRIIIESQYFFWLWAIASLNLYRGWLTGHLTNKMPVYYLAIPTMIGFVLVDWLMNRTVFAIVCWEWALDKNELVTTRMSRYRSDFKVSAYRKRVADFTCGLLNLFNFDATNHC